MSKIRELCCPDCKRKIIDTRTTVQPYNDFDDYAGFRCGGCGRQFTDEEIGVMKDTLSKSNQASAK